MRTGLVVVLALMLGAIAAHFLLQDNGYVLINTAGYAIEMSLPILTLVLALAYTAIRLIIRVWRAPRRLGEAAARARTRRAGELVTRGLIEVAGGRLARGEKLLTRGIRNSEAPLVNYLTAARTAHVQRDRERRDQWLAMAYEQEPDAANAVLLTQAELQLADEEDERALATLQKILDDVPAHLQALQMLADLHEKKARWTDLMEVALKLRRIRGGDRQHADRAMLLAAIGQLEQPSLAADDIERITNELDRAQKRDVGFVAAYANALERAGESDKAAKLIRKTLGSGWSDALVEIYGRLDHADLGSAIKYVEGQLQDRPEDPVLLLTAGRLCVRNELWGKARSYLESSIAIRPDAKTWHELGTLMQELGEGEAASNAFRRGLAITQGVDPDQPQLAKLDAD